MKTDLSLSKICQKYRRLFSGNGVIKYPYKSVFEPAKKVSYSKFYCLKNNSEITAQRLHASNKFSSLFSANNAKVKAADAP